MGKRLLTLTLCCTITVIALATNYFVSPDGTGNGLRKANPAPLRITLAKLEPGDSLFLMGGQYDFDRALHIAISGTETQRIFIGGNPGEKPIFDFRKEALQIDGVIVTADFIHLRSITIRYAGHNGLYVGGGSYNIIENIDSYGNYSGGFCLRFGHSNIVKNCDAHDNFDYKYTTEEGNCNFGENADGFHDWICEQSPCNTYIGCRSWNNSDDGWDFIRRIGSTTNIIGCISYANGPKNYDMSSHPRVETDKEWFDQFKEGKYVTLKDGTQVWCTLNEYHNTGNGNGFKLGGGSTKHDVCLYRCLAIGNSQKGFDQNSNAGDIVIYNCTAYANSTNYGFYNDNGYSLDIANCASLGGKIKDLIRGSKITQRNNTWNLEGCNENDFKSLDVASLLLQPRRADGSLPFNDLLRLSSSSALIDKGIQIDGIDHLGTSPDLGCYEYGETEVEATPFPIATETPDALQKDILDTLTATCAETAIEYTFFGGYSITNNKNKGYVPGKSNTIKYSLNTRYTIHLPEGLNITSITLTGYANSDDTDSYLSELNGTTYGTTDYVFPDRKTHDFATETYTLQFPTPITDHITFAVAGAQTCLTITLKATTKESTTFIQHMKPHGKSAQHTYDVQGHLRPQATTRGIYIMDGKKYYNK